MVGEIAKKILVKLAVTAGLSGLYAYVDYKLNGEESAVGIIRNVWRYRKQINDQEKTKDPVVLKTDEYTVV